MKRGTQHNNTLYSIVYAECHKQVLYDEYRYAECHGAQITPEI